MVCENCGAEHYAGRFCSERCVAAAIARQEKKKEYFRKMLAMIKQPSPPGTPICGYDQDGNWFEGKTR